MTAANDRPPQRSTRETIRNTTEEPGRFIGRAPCPACRLAWTDGEPMRPVLLREGYGIAADRGIIAARCLVCGRTWRGSPGQGTAAA